MEITAASSQTVAANSNVLFTDVVVPGSASIMHRVNSGLVSLRGLTNQPRARFRVTYSGNVGIPTGGAVAAVSLAIAISGEPVVSNTMISTPAATTELNNVSTTCFIDVPAGCCMTISVQNTSTAAVLVQNADLVVERVA